MYLMGSRVTVLKFLVVQHLKIRGETGQGEDLVEGYIISVSGSKDSLVRVWYLVEGYILLVIC
jgi:hypothetical protein